MRLSPLLVSLPYLNLAAFLWRGAMRFAFTTRVYGVAEGLMAILRIPVANAIAIMAARRAVGAYIRTLRGGEPRWDKTPHTPLPIRADALPASAA